MHSILYDNQVLDWTMRNDSTFLPATPNHRPSIIVKQSIDENVMDILRSSGETTWKSIDALRDTIMEQKQILISIKAMTSQQNHDENGQAGRAPAENPSVTGDCTMKEAMTQKNNVKEAETSKNNVQKRLSSTSSVRRLERHAIPSTSCDKPSHNDKGTNPSKKSVRQGNNSYQLNSEVEWTVVSTKNSRSQRGSATQHDISVFNRKNSRGNKAVFWSKLDMDYDLDKALDVLIHNNLVKPNRNHDYIAHST